MTGDKKKPVLFKYDHPATYLRDACAYVQMEKPHFTLRRIAKALGLDNTSVFFNILKGRRHITPILLIKITQFFNLTDEEKRFLELLINYNKSKDTGKKAIFSDEITKILNRHKVLHVDLEKFSKIKSWHYLAILEALSLKEYKNLNNSQLAQLFIPELTPFDIQEAYSKLQSLGFIEPDPQHKNKFKRTSNLSLAIGKLIPSDAIRHYHDQAIALSRNALLNGKMEDRNFISLTIAVKKDHIKIIEEKMSEFNDTLLNLATAEDSDCIYRVNLHGFKLTRTKDK